AQARALTYTLSLHDALPIWTFFGPRRTHMTFDLETLRDCPDDQRALMAADWLFRSYVPTWLRVAGLEAAAARIEAHGPFTDWSRSEEHTSELQSRENLVCRL